MKRFRKFNQLLGALSVVTVFSSIILFSSSLTAATHSGIEWLEKMSMAADRLDYSGEFVVVKDGDIASMRIVHAYTEAGTQQKLMSLNGSMREIIQQDNIVACVLPDQGMGMREKRQADQPFSLSITNKVEDLKRHYTIEKMGPARVANRDCERLRVEPKDQYRYGYKLCIDRENYLLLSAELTHASGDVLENYMFVDVSFEKVNEKEFASATLPDTLDWMDDNLSAKISAEMNEANSNEAQKWQVASNITGFELMQYIERVSPILQAEVTHMVLGDGLAKVSVFVSPNDNKQRKSSAPLKLGSLNSYSKALGDHMITVIGEVPEQTVNLIAENTQVFQ